MAEDGELVESGTFRVDRKLALEKLKEHQLPDPAMFLLPWVRCAVASGATEITLHNHDKQQWPKSVLSQHDSLETSSEGQEWGWAAPWLEMRFDGRPFTPEELRRPFECLLDEATPENARNRNLAIGMLSALRLHPLRVGVTSGNGPGRVRLRVEFLDVYSCKPIEDDFVGDTVLWVRWPMSFSKAERQAMLRHAARFYQIRPASLKIYSTLEETIDLPRDPAPAKHDLFQKGGVSGRIQISGDLDRRRSVIRLYHYGVYVETIKLDLPLVQVEGDINDDQFALNISQSGVVRNARFEQTMKLAQAKAEQLRNT